MKIWEESISGTDKDEDAGGRMAAKGLNADDIGEHVCNMTSNHGVESNLEVTGGICAAVDKDKSGRNSDSLKRTCLEMYIL